MDDPAISVVMSCFNDEACVGEAIRSIQLQSLTDWELIAIDDGSSDGTLSVLKSYAADDSRIRVFTQQNSGLTRALIEGCAIARGQYIARQDADDRSSPERLSLQKLVLDQNPGVGFVSCFADYIGPRGEYLSTVTRPLDANIATSLLLDEVKRLGPPAHGSVMFRKSVYQTAGGYRPEFYYAQDADLWLRMAEISNIAYVADRLYKVQLRSTSISGAASVLQKEFGNIARSCVQIRRFQQSEQPLLRRAAELSRRVVENRVSSTQCYKDTRNPQTMTYLIGSQLVANGDSRSRHYLWNVIRKHPWHLRAWLRLVQSYFCSPTRSEK